MLLLGLIDLPHEFISTYVKNVIADKSCPDKAIDKGNISLRRSFLIWVSRPSIYLPNIPLNKPIFVIHVFSFSVFDKCHLAVEAVDDDGEVGEEVVLIIISANLPMVQL